MVSAGEQRVGGRACGQDRGPGKQQEQDQRQGGNAEFFHEKSTSIREETPENRRKKQKIQIIKGIQLQNTIFPAALQRPDPAR